MILAPLLILICSLFILLIIGVPIFVSLGLSSIITFMTTAHMPMAIIAQKFYSNIFSVPLMAVPFFLLTSSLMEYSGLSQRIINLADAIVGRVRGNLAITGVVACMLFSSISGSSLATVAGIGSILMPRMLEQGYDRRLAIGSIAAAGTLGILIPPSVPLIIYSMVTGTSVLKLFLAAIVPAVLLSLAFIVTAIFFINKGNFSQDAVIATWRERRKKFREGVWTLLIPLGIFIGIYGIPGVTSAIFTATEAAVVSFFLAIFVGTFIYREFQFKEIPKVITESTSHIGMILIIVATAMLFSFVVNNAGIPQTIADFLVDIHLSKVAFLLIVNLLLFIAGQFMDAVPIIMIFIPVLFPAAMALGIDPVHFGILTVVNMELGCITPPVGLNLYMASNITNLSLVEVTKTVLPWILVIVFVLFVITYVPALSLWLPNIAH